MFYLLQILLSICVVVAQPMSFYSYKQFHAPLSWETLTNSGLEKALASCQQSFKWQRWNCPSQDFFKRHSAPAAAQELDREDVFVAAISMAAIVHQLTHDCANGVIAGCGCSDNALNVPCAHEPAKALEQYEKHFGVGTDAAAHNQRVVGALLQQSMEEKCYCKQPGAQGKCLEEQCVLVLKSFDSIAQDLLQMYDDAIQLDTTVDNLKIMWQNIPLDSLVYMQDSPNYCEAEASGRWTGTRGRQCSKTGGSSSERMSCQQLCKVCGFRVRTKQVRSQGQCNCKLIWGNMGNMHIQCDLCEHREQQYSCY